MQNKALPLCMMHVIKLTILTFKYIFIHISSVIYHNSFLKVSEKPLCSTIHMWAMEIHDELFSDKKLMTKKKSLKKSHETLRAILCRDLPNLKSYNTNKKWQQHLDEGGLFESILTQLTDWCYNLNFYYSKTFTK